jgi:hypothetical protein
MNYTLGVIRIDNKTSSKIYPPTQFFKIAQYLSERGFVVLRYERGIGENSTIIDNNIWGNVTSNDLIHDAEKAVNVLVHQPEVDAKKISIIGHSEGGAITTRVAIDNPITKIKNIVLMAARSQNAHDLMYRPFVGLPLEYAKQVFDKNHTGSIPIQQVVKDPIFGQYVAFSLTNNQNYSTNATNIGTLNNLLLSEKSSNSNSTLARHIVGSTAAGSINIDKQLKPMLERTFESAFKASTGEIPSNKCEMPALCPIYFKSVVSLKPTLNIINNVSSSTDILILHGQNDSASPVQASFLLQQTLTDKRHPDHTLITYPNLCHFFYPSSEWQTSYGPIPEYVLADLYAWLESHSGFTSTPATSMPSSTYSSSSNSTTTK